MAAEGVRLQWPEVQHSVTETSGMCKCSAPSSLQPRRGYLQQTVTSVVQSTTALAVPTPRVEPLHGKGHPTTVFWGASLDQPCNGPGLLGRCAQREQIERGVWTSETASERQDPRLYTV